MIGRTTNNDGLAYIDLDFEAAIIQAYAHLIDLGHHDIACLTYSEDWRLKGLGPAMRSLRGFHMAVDRFGVRPVYRECALDVERAYCTTRQLVANEPRLTAFVAMHNTIAVGAIRGLRDMRLRIPEDRSIVGVAIEKQSDLVIPPLTALTFPAHEVGRQAAHMLLQQLNGAGAISGQILVAPNLHIRASTAPVKAV
jgi:DNA-binding LacI/PurR family transcriptional regulator